MTAPTRAGLIALIYDLKLASRRVGADPTEPRHADAEAAAGRALLRYAAEACPVFGGGACGGDADVPPFCGRCFPAGRYEPGCMLCGQCQRAMGAFAGARP